MNVDFITAIKMFFANYANFKGRSTRAEYWWVALFTFIVSMVLSWLGSFGTILNGIFSLAIIVPSLALSTRRLHDINLSGWVLVGFYVVLFALAVWMGAAFGGQFVSLLLGDATVAAEHMDDMAIAGKVALPAILMLVVGIVYLVLMCKKSGPDNQYGPDPYGE